MGAVQNVLSYFILLGYTLVLLIESTLVESRPK